MIDPRNINCYFQIELDPYDECFNLSVIRGKKTLFKSDCSLELTSTEIISTKAKFHAEWISVYVSISTKDLYNLMAKRLIDRICLDETIDSESLDKKILKTPLHPIARNIEVLRADVSSDDKLIKITSISNSMLYFSDYLNYGIEIKNNQHTGYEKLVFEGLKTLRILDPSSKSLISYDLANKELFTEKNRVIK